MGFLLLHHRLVSQTTGQLPPQATVNQAAYNAKMLALANLKPRHDCFTKSELARARSGQNPKAPLAPGKPRPRAREQRVALRKVRLKRLRPCKPPLWPVRTVYPDAGALLPFNRIVAYYGNFYSKHMGILGQYPPDMVLARLKKQAAAWAAADPATPVLQAVDYIAASAQQEPGRDGKYILRMPRDQIEKALQMANQIHGLLFLDVQPGWSTVRAELPRLEPFLKLPNVELALDPEFALVPGKKPGRYRGTMSAAQINIAARYLARLAAQYHLPPKILVVHRFTQRMVSDYRGIRPLPEVEIVMDMDGFGSPALKTAAYRAFIARQPVQFTGFKIFYWNDWKRGGKIMSPADVLRLSPRPSFILYQ